MCVHGIFPFKSNPGKVRRRITKIVFVEPCLDVVMNRIEQAFALPGRCRGENQLRRFNIFFDGITTDAKLPGDGPLRQPLTVP